VLDQYNFDGKCAGSFFSQKQGEFRVAVFFCTPTSPKVNDFSLLLSIKIK